MTIEIIDFRTHRKNTLEGFATIRLTKVGMEIRDMAFHQKNGKRWLQLPAKPYSKPDGSKGWSYIISFYEKDKYNQFQAVALEALDAYQRDIKRNGDGHR